jgi:DNA-binding SARP family transcriptional activator
MAPPHDFEVRLLGRPAMRAAGGWSDLRPGLISALLGYLAFQRRWVDRAELIALFWPDRSEDVARGNLRPLLWRLANEPVSYGLERDRSLLRWPVSTDHQAFVEACRAQSWKDAWALPRGELLTGVSLPAAPEFDTWLEMERATVRSALRTAGMRAAEEATRAGSLDEAVDVLADLYRLDTFDEEVLRALMGALHRRNARSDALDLMSRFERLCREELGTEPEAATQALAAAIRTGPVERTTQASADARGAAPRRPATLPVPLTPFVGRRDLVASVSRTTVDGGCRVLTLVGPGGVGKTRIAIEVAQEVEGRFEEGARFIELAALSSEGALLAAVAGAMGTALATGEDPGRARARGATDAPRPRQRGAPRRGPDVGRGAGQPGSWCGRSSASTEACARRSGRWTVGTPGPSCAPNADGCAKRARCAAGRWRAVASPLPKSRPWATRPRWRWRRSHASSTSRRITGPRSRGRGVPWITTDAGTDRRPPTISRRPRSCASR